MTTSNASVIEAFYTMLKTSTPYEVDNIIRNLNNKVLDGEFGSRTVKVAINKSCSTFEINDDLLKELKSLNPSKVEELQDNGMTLEESINRDDPLLIQALENIGEKANVPVNIGGLTGLPMKMEIVKFRLPYGVIWNIVEYDGVEHITKSSAGGGNMDIFRY